MGVVLKLRDHYNLVVAPAGDGSGTGVAVLMEELPVRSQALDLHEGFLAYLPQDLDLHGGFLAYLPKGLD